MKNKVMITGAGGYIGSVCCYDFLSRGYEVIAIDNFKHGHKQPLQTLQKKYGKEKLRYYEIDLRNDLSSIFEEETGIEAIIHFAALCSVDESMKKPSLYFDNNVCATHNLIKTMTHYAVPAIIFSSTCAIYGEAEYMPVDENHPSSPGNVYGSTKKITEEMLEWYRKTGKLNYIVLRYFNVTGATEDGLIGDSKKPSLLLVQNAVRGALGIEDFHLTCPAVNTADKTPIRDYLNVEDLVTAHHLAYEYVSHNNMSTSINLGTGKGNSVLEVIKTVETITGKSIPLKKAHPRDGEYSSMIASTKKAERILKWRPRRSLEDSIKSLIKWYTKHPQGWEE